MTTRAFALANLLGADNKIDLSALPDEATEGGDALGTVTGADLDLSAGNFFEVTAADQTLTFSNPPPVHEFKIKLTGAGTVSGYVLSAARFDSALLRLETLIGSFAFNNDGTKLYTIGWGTGRAFVHEHNLSTAFDVNTLSYDSVSFDFSAQISSAYGISFNADGTKMYIAYSSVYQYSLSTAFDISTASYDSVSFDVSSQESQTRSIVFSSDGTRMYIVGSVSRTVYQYTLSTAFDISTASYDSVSFDVSAQETSPTGLFFKPDGGKMYIVGNSSDIVYQYTLSTAFDLSTASYDSKVFDTSSQEATPTGITFNTEGTRMYIIGSVSDSVHQYTLSTAFDISTVSYDSVSLRVGGQDTAPQDITFNNDGTRMYIVGSTSDSVYQYDLSTAFDVGTASYGSVAFNISTEDSAPYGVALSNDGSKMYIVGISSDSVHQYTLSTAFDLSTASYDSVSFNVNSEEATPTGITFNTEGTRMYIVGRTSDSVHQYTLSTAFDISTVSYDSVSLSVGGQDTAPQGITFSSDGTRMYMVGSTSDSVHEYELSTAFDVGAASYTGVFISVAGQEAAPQGITFSSDGTRMYIVGTSSDTVFQYPTSSTTLATVSYPSTTLFSGGAPPAIPEIGKVDTLGFYTVDGGSTFYAYQIGDNQG